MLKGFAVNRNSALLIDSYFARVENSFEMLQVLTERDGVYTIRVIVPGIGRRPDYSVADRLIEMGVGQPREGMRQLRGRYGKSKPVVVGTF